MITAVSAHYAALRAWPRIHPRRYDAGVATVFFLLLVSWWPAALVDPPPVNSGIPDRRAFFLGLLVLGVVHTIGVYLRRRRPVLAFSLVSLACAVQLFLGALLPSDVAVLVVSYCLARYAESMVLRRAGLGVLAASGYLALVFTMPATPVWTLLGGTTLSVMVMAMWLWGDLNRKRGELVAGLEAQNVALRRDRDQRAELAAQAERARIARDMHDVVAHGLSVIVVQADGAGYAAEHAPTWEREQAASALTTIAATAREALQETRRLVGVLRADADAQYRPTSGLSDIETLVAQARDAGLTVQYSRTGPELHPDRDVQLAAFRVVQESLTNAIKHAGPGAVVHVGVDTGGPLRITVWDNGRGTATLDDGAGNGLIGMRERITAVGGSIDSGPRPGGGWQVRAAVPMQSGVHPKEQATP